MRFVTALLIPLSLPLLITGCAKVKFLEGGEEKGFLYYPAKPYLVVENTAEGATARLVSVPDYAQPSRVKYRAGWGSVQFGFDTSHGMLTKFNATSDSQGDETIGAIAGLAGFVTGAAALDTAAAALITARAARGDSKARAAAGASPFPVIPIETAHNSMGKVLSALGAAPSPPVTKLDKVRETLGRLHSELQGLINISYDDTAPDADERLIGLMNKRRAEVREWLKLLIREVENLDEIAADANTVDADKQRADVAARGLRAVAQILRDFAAVTPAIRIYEIVHRDGRIQFDRVQFNERD